MPTFCRPPSAGTDGAPDKLAGELHLTTETDSTVAGLVLTPGAMDTGVKTEGPLLGSIPANERPVDLA